MKRIAIKQHDLTDCGAACLASVAAYYKLHLPIARIRQYASTDSKGTTVLGLIEAAEKLGFSAKGVKGPYESLINVPFPAIAHFRISGELEHFVVLTQVTQHHVKVMDPADGRFHKLAPETFQEQWTGVLLLLAPAEDFSQGNQTVSVFRRFSYLLQPHSSVLFQVLLGAMVYTLLGLTVSVFLQQIIDRVLPDGNRNLLHLMGIVMVGLLMLQIFINHCKNLLTIKTGQQIDTRLILGYYKHLLKLPQRFFDTMRTGEIISRIGDAVKISTFINDAMISLAVNVFIIVFSFVLMFTIYWKLAVLMLLILPTYTLVYYFSNRVNRLTQRKLMEDNAGLESQLVESISAIGTIKRFGLESFANMKTEQRFIRFMQTSYRSSLNSLWIGDAGSLASGIFTILLLWIGASFVLNGYLSPGQLLSFYAIIGYFIGPVSSLIGMNRTMQDAVIAADRLFEIMDLEQEETVEKIVLLPEMIGNIRFNGVHFRYGASNTVFRNLNLEIRRGKVTAIVGESGSGKTTLLSLLQGIYSLQDGSITIGNFDIRYLKHESLRSMVSVVPQQIDLFNGNIIENIAVGEMHPDLKRVMLVCSELGMTDFIDKLPQGYHTPIGENGVSLSGGQRQRLAIARALYRDPEILILDEATSSLDGGSESYIQQVIASLRSRGKTVILIAHRLSTVVSADMIVVLQEGVVLETGTHETLTESRGAYYQMWIRQFPRINKLGDPLYL